jgi:hypothetical protein
MDGIFVDKRHGVPSIEKRLFRLLLAINDDVLEMDVRARSYLPEHDALRAESVITSGHDLLPRVILELILAYNESVDYDRRQGWLLGLQNPVLSRTCLVGEKFGIFDWLVENTLSQTYINWDFGEDWDFGQYCSYHLRDNFGIQMNSCETTSYPEKNVHILSICCSANPILMTATLSDLLLIGRVTPSTRILLISHRPNTAGDPNVCFRNGQRSATIGMFEHNVTFFTRTCLRVSRVI